MSKDLTTESSSSCDFWLCCFGFLALAGAFFGVPREESVARASCAKQI